MIAVRDIIREAAIRVNVGSRRQALPGGIEETALKLLQGIVAKYNNDNLLNWTQNYVILKSRDLIHMYSKDDSLAGENNLYFDTDAERNSYTLTREDFENNVYAMVKSEPRLYYTVESPEEDVYIWKGNTAEDIPSQRIQLMQRYCKMEHVKVNSVAKINSVYISVTGKIDGFNNMAELKFKAPADFDKYTMNAAVYTTFPRAEGEFLIQMKPIVVAQRWAIKVNYNEKIDFDIDSDLTIPDNYVELLIVALAHKLAIQFPRIDDSQFQRLENDLKVLVDNVRTPKAEDRMLNRMNYDYGFGTERTMTTQELMSGSWF